MNTVILKFDNELLLTEKLISDTLLIANTERVKAGKGILDVETIIDFDTLVVNSLNIQDVFELGFSLGISHTLADQLAQKEYISSLDED